MPPVMRPKVDELILLSIVAPEKSGWLAAFSRVHPVSGATIDSSINSATFGRVTGGSGARIIVLGARLNW